MDIVSVGVVFPVIFAVQAAYNQRSEAIAHLNQMKVSSDLLYWYGQKLFSCVLGDDSACHYGGHFLG